MTSFESLFFFCTQDKTLTVWMSHGDEVVTLPPGFELIARYIRTHAHVRALMYVSTITHTRTHAHQGTCRANKYTHLFAPARTHHKKIFAFHNSTILISYLTSHYAAICTRVYIPTHTIMCTRSHVRKYYNSHFFVRFLFLNYSYFIY